MGVLRPITRKDVRSFRTLASEPAFALQWQHHRARAEHRVLLERLAWSGALSGEDCGGPVDDGQPSGIRCHPAWTDELDGAGLVLRDRQNLLLAGRSDQPR